MDIEILFYPTGDDGPVKDYLENLRLAPQKKHAGIRLIQDIAILEAEGLQSKQISIRSLSNIHSGLWEIRRNFEGMLYRIYFVTKKGGKFWLIHYIEKKSQKIPKDDVNILKKRSKEIK